MKRLIVMMMLLVIFAVAAIPFIPEPEPATLTQAASSAIFSN